MLLFGSVKEWVGASTAALPPHPQRTRVGFEGSLRDDIHPSGSHTSGELAMPSKSPRRKAKTTSKHRPKGTAPAEQPSASAGESPVPPLRRRSADVPLPAPVVQIRHRPGPSDRPRWTRRPGAGTGRRQVQRAGLSHPSGAPRSCGPAVSRDHCPLLVSDAEWDGGAGPCVDRREPSRRPLSAGWTAVLRACPVGRGKSPGHAAGTGHRGHSGQRAEAAAEADRPQESPHAAARSSWRKRNVRYSRTAARSDPTWPCIG